MSEQTMHERLTELHFKGDIGMYYCGKRIGTKNHEYGPEIRNHYLFVLVNKGKAIMCHDKQIAFGEHDLLIMLPNERIHYKALEEWSISWLGLYGETVDKFIKILGITPDNPTIHVSLYNELYNIMEKVYNISKDLSLSSKFSATGLIYEFFSILVQNANIGKDNVNSVKTALRIMDYNYSSPITVEQIAKRLSLNTSYFSRFFSEQVGTSPKQYLLNKRIERAKELLLETNASIFEIANSVGYDDQLYFSRIFKKHIGLSPLKYRNMYYQNTN